VWIVRLEEQLWESYLNDELSMFMLLHFNIWM